MADTFTANLNLTKPEFDKPRYHQAMNENLDVIDAVIAQYIGGSTQGAWKNSTTYAIDDIVVDTANGLLYIALSPHTSPGAPTTFAQFRAANPSVWQLATTSFQTILTQCQTAATNASNSAGAAATSATSAAASNLFTPEEVNTTTYTLVLGDKNKLKFFTHASGCAVTVPTNASVAFEIGTQIMLRQDDTDSQVTVAGDTGVTITSKFGRLKSENAQYAMMVLLKTATNTWQLTGDLSA